MGKEMEEAGNEWRCPACKKKEKIGSVTEKTSNDLELKLEAKLQKENENNECGNSHTSVVCMVSYMQVLF